MTKSSHLPRAVREYLRTIGKRGGSAKGQSKARGDADHYRDMARARWGPPKSPVTR